MLDIETTQGGWKFGGAWRKKRCPKTTDEPTTTEEPTIDIVKMNNIPKRVSCGRDTCTCVSVCPFRFDFHFGFENKIYCILLLRYLRELLVITIGERPWNK